jgi:hypothetical protein
VTPNEIAVQRRLTAIPLSLPQPVQTGVHPRYRPGDRLVVGKDGHPHPAGVGIEPGECLEGLVVAEHQLPGHGRGEQGGGDAVGVRDAARAGEAAVDLDMVQGLGGRPAPVQAGALGVGL